jgi:hypothetical protein
MSSTWAWLAECFCCGSGKAERIFSVLIDDDYDPGTDIVRGVSKEDYPKYARAIFAHIKNHCRGEMQEAALDSALASTSPLGKVFARSADGQNLLQELAAYKAGKFPQTEKRTSFTFSARANQRPSELWPLLGSDKGRGGRKKRRKKARDKGGRGSECSGSGTEEHDTARVSRSNPRRRTKDSSDSNNQAGAHRPSSPSSGSS